MKSHLQRAGAFLAGMVVPNISVFIAWGLLTACVIPTGWTPNPRLARLVDPTILYLLPLLIGFSGGRLVYGNRGGVVGAMAVMGVVVGSTVPMFLGAMFMGPVGALLIRTIDRAGQGRIPAGFEMLVENFSGGLAGLALMAAGYMGIGGLVQSIIAGLATAAHAITAAGWLPAIALIIEPAKVLFVNNAINHGVLAPLGVAEAREVGKSVYFLLESNPGPGFGLLAAYALFGKGTARTTAPGAILIQFFGGIHELYFPYVLMNPLSIVAVIAGGLAGDAVFVALRAGLVATPSPGSIFAEIAMAPKGGLLPVLLGIGAAACVSFLVAAPLVRRAEINVTPVPPPLDGAARPAEVPRSVLFVCEAGMGSSVMGQSILKRKLRAAGIGIAVDHAALSDLPPRPGIVVAHRSLTARIREFAPEAEIYPVDEFIRTPVYDELIRRLAPVEAKG